MTNKLPPINKLIADLILMADNQSETLLDKNYKSMQEQARKLKVQEDLITKLNHQQSAKDEYISKLEMEVNNLSNMCDNLVIENESLNKLLDEYEDDQHEETFCNNAESITREYAEKMNEQSQCTTGDRIEAYQEEVNERLDVIEQSLSKLINAYNSHLRDIHDATPNFTGKRRTPQR